MKSENGKCYSKLAEKMDMIEDKIKEIRCSLNVIKEMFCSSCAEKAKQSNSKTKDEK
tara:strand:- start:229 stop:399 length:171 start_codon:yes stop_codon:yes gene_type:complete